MSLFCRLLVAVFCLSLPGCGDDSASPVDPAAKEDFGQAEDPAVGTVSSFSPKPTEESSGPKSHVEFTILKGGPKAPGQSDSVGDHRSQRILVSGAKAQGEFEGAVRKAFEALAEEIEESNKDSKSKRVEVFAYDNLIDAEARDVYTLHAFSAAGAVKPRWEKAQLDWRWRLPEFRPSERWLRIHADYRMLRATAEKLSDAQKELCVQYKLTDDEFIDIHAYMMMWHSGLAPEGDLLEEWKVDLRKKQDLD